MFFNILIFIISVAVPLDMAKAFNISAENYLNNRHYERLIEDNHFISTKSMNVSQIQSFLDSKGSFLKSYSEEGRSAAQIIYDAANGLSEDSRGSLAGIVVDQTTGTINPMAILVTLQKEQSLITTTDFNQSKLNWAMGYGCLEDGSWNPAYKGFAKQVDWGAWQLRYNFHRAEASRTNLPNYKEGQTMTFSNTKSPYNPPSTLSVTLTNRATASLYRYTPHAFNGNYNFWKLFHEWFLDVGWYIPPPGIGGGSLPVSMSTYSSSLVIGSTCSMSVSPPIGTTSYNVPCPNGETQRIIITRHKPADINGDGKVDLLDLSTFAKYWGKSKPAVQLANLNPDVDEEVNLLDLSIIATNWSK